MYGSWGRSICVRDCSRVIKKGEGHKRSQWVGQKRWTLSDGKKRTEYLCRSRGLLSSVWSSFGRHLVSQPGLLRHTRIYGLSGNRGVIFYSSV